MGKAFDSIKTGLNEAIAHAKGAKAGAGVRVYRPQVVDVRKLRLQVGMTQEQFAARFGFSVATLRHWERGDRAPAGPALVLLNVIAKDHKAVMRALVANVNKARA
jgi:putative transcriptional regulator